LLSVFFYFVIFWLAGWSAQAFLSSKSTIGGTYQGLGLAPKYFLCFDALVLS